MDRHDCGIGGSKNDSRWKEISIDYMNETGSFIHLPSLLTIGFFVDLVLCWTLSMFRIGFVVLTVVFSSVVKSNVILERIVSNDVDFFKSSVRS